MWYLFLSVLHVMLVDCGPLVTAVPPLLTTLSLLSFFFFFQAEDGIRDLIVTGVQTCALPIWAISGPPTSLGEPEPFLGAQADEPVRHVPHLRRARDGLAPAQHHQDVVRPDRKSVV